MWTLSRYTYERYGEGRPGDGVGDHEQEDGERQQHGDAEWDLLAGVGRQTETDHDEHREHDARQHNVHDVELVATLQMQLEDDVCVAMYPFRLVAALTVSHTHNQRRVYGPMMMMMMMMKDE